MLHLTNGDVAAERLRQARVPGEAIVWADVLHEGPVPATNDARRFRETRARYLAARRYGDFAQILERFEQWHAALAKFREHEELVLWFEHDLFDQLLIARHLHWLGHEPPFSTTVSLICIDSFPGIAPFRGLGQLSPGQLATLMSSRRPISAEQLTAGAEVWRALTAPDPRALGDLARRSMPHLPFMPDALIRLLEELPWTGDGLSRTERGVLAHLSGGPASVSALFRALQEEEERVFMGDTSFRGVVLAMSAGETPLVKVHERGSAGDGSPDGVVEIAPAGLEVAAHGADAVVLRGIERFVGGTHLSGRGPVWRWDPGVGRVRLI